MSAPGGFRFIGHTPTPAQIDGAADWAMRQVTFNVGALAIELERLGVPRDRLTPTGVYAIALNIANQLTALWIREGHVRRGGTRCYRWVGRQ